MLWEMLGDFLRTFNTNAFDISLVLIFSIGLYNVLDFIFSLRPKKR